MFGKKDIHINIVISEGIDCRYIFIVRDTI